jgi:hypothetical protein
MGATPKGSGSRPSGRAAKGVSPVPASIPSAERRRTFKPFAQAPLDGTPFHVPHIFRYNRFAKTFEALMRDQMSGELEWVACPRVWRSNYFCDLLPLSLDPPKAFAVTYAAQPVPRKTWRSRVANKLFGWLRVPNGETPNA